MANDAYYLIKLKGSKENRDAFIKKMNDYDEPNHFWRIFQCMVIEETEEFTTLEGDCAWSLETCCRASGYSEGIDLFEVNTKDLDLELEAYSSEPGIGFEEHYIYIKGDCTVDECVEMIEYWWDPSEYTFKEFKEECDLPDDLTEDDLVDGQYYKDGGFGEWTWNI